MARIQRETIKNGLSDPNKHLCDHHLKVDILECEVKWTLGSVTMNKASGADEIPAELFQILKADVVKVLPSIYQ